MGNLQRPYRNKIGSELDRKCEKLFQEWITKNYIARQIRKGWPYLFRKIRRIGTWQTLGYGNNKIYGTMRIPYGSFPPLYDHGSLWEKENGDRVCVFHTYNLIEGEREKLLIWAEKYNIKVIIYEDRNSSWYYPGSTWMIELHSKVKVI